MAEVRLENVTKAYGETLAVDQVSLTVASGEFVTLLGPSGCGKTTTLRVVAGLVEGSSGRIAIAGRDVTAIPTHKRNIGMAFQSHALFPHMTVADNVAFGLKMRGLSGADRRSRVAEALDMVRLSGFGGRYPAQLSGGQQQRVALARALVINPDVLLLDEPFGALDRKLRETMQEELRDLTRRIGITAMFVTHDQEEALILSDRIAVMNAGRIEQSGTPSEVFEFPSTRFVADFMGVANLLPARVTGVTGDRVSLDADGLLMETRMVGAAPAIGTEIAAGIRAERIAVAAGEGARAPNTIGGRIQSAIYHGNQTTYIVDIGGRTLTARESNQQVNDGGARLKENDAAVLTWEAASVRVLQH